MKKAFSIYVEDDCDLRTVQVAVFVQRKNNGGNGVTFFALSEKELEDQKNWLFKVDGQATTIEPQGSEVSE